MKALSFAPSGLYLVVISFAKALQSSFLQKLSLVLDDLIAPNQGAFVKGRNILNDVMLRQKRVTLW